MRVRRPGIALMLVLVAAASVFTLAMQGAVSSQLGTIETTSVLRSDEGEVVARGAATIALMGLIGTAIDEAPAQEGVGSTTGADHGAAPVTPDDIELPPLLRRMLEETGADVEKAAQDALLSDATNSALDGGGLGAVAPTHLDIAGAVSVMTPTQPIDVHLDGWTCRLWITDGAGGLNINEASEGQLLRYLRAMDVPAPTDRAIASQIIDWRDDDAFINERGAEREVYERRGIVHRDGRFRTLRELLYLPAMTPALFARIEPDLCTSSDGRVHLGSASRAVLQATGVLNTPHIDQLLQLRAQGALSETTASRFIDLDDEAAGEVLRLEASPILRLRLEAYPPGATLGNPAAALAFEGAAIIGDRGLRELGLRPATGRWPTMPGRGE